MLFRDSIIKKIISTTLVVLMVSLIFKSSSAHADALDVSLFPVPTQSQGIPFLAPGPDGNMWFTLTNENKIAKSTPEGVITEYTVPTPNSAPTVIVAGPDGNMWFTEQSGHNVGKIDMNGNITEYNVDDVLGIGTYLVPLGIAVGPDNNLWVGSYPAGGSNQGRLIRVTTSGAMTSYPVSTDFRNVALVKAGADGNMWFTSGGSSGQQENRVGKITMSGAITEYLLPDLGCCTLGLTLGGDGSMWYIRVMDFSGGGGRRIGKITPSGSIQEFTLPAGNLALFGMTTTPDGQVWFVDTTTNDVLKISPDGVTTSYSLPADFSIYTVEVDGSGNLWFGEASLSGEASNIRIAKLNTYPDGGVTAPLTPSAPPTPSSPKTGRLLVASVITSLLVGFTILAGFAFKKKMHRSNTSAR